MDKQIKELWVNGLRSDKYKQGRGYLRPTEDTYCYLGVLCDVLIDILPNDITWTKSDEGYYFFDDERFGLPNCVYNFLKITPYDLKVKYYETEVYLSQLNDNYRLTFKEIADIIENQL